MALESGGPLEETVIALLTRVSTSTGVLCLPVSPCGLGLPSAPLSVSLFLPLCLSYCLYLVPYLSQSLYAPPYVGLCLALSLFLSLL